MTDNDKKQFEDLDAKLKKITTFQKELLFLIIAIMVVTFIAGIANSSIIALWVGLGEIPFFLLAIIVPIIQCSKLKKQLAPYREMYAKEQFELEQHKLDNIKKTVIVETHTAKNADQVKNRGVAGALLFGTAGAVVGTASAGDNTFTTFLIVYNDDTRETRVVENGSALYNYYIKFLEI